MKLVARSLRRGEQDVDRLVGGECVGAQEVHHPFVDVLILVPQLVGQDVERHVDVLQLLVVAEKQLGQEELSVEVLTRLVACRDDG